MTSDRHGVDILTHGAVAMTGLLVQPAPETKVQ